MRRTLREIKEMSRLKTNNFCCIHEPLLNIELDHIILDELHLLLRITDGLEVYMIIYTSRHSLHITGIN